MTLETRLKAIKLNDFHLNENGVITLGDQDIGKIKAVFVLYQAAQNKAVVQS